MTTNIINTVTCHHPSDLGGTITYFVRRPERGIDRHDIRLKDWGFAILCLARRVSLQELESPAFSNYPKNLTSIQLCYKCSELLPSERKKKKQKAQSHQEALSEEEVPKLQEILEQLEAGEPLYFCHGCEEFKDEDELVELRECPHCEEIYDGNEGRNCPSCNRPFTRNLEIAGCSDCLDADNPPELATEELVKEMMSAG